MTNKNKVGAVSQGDMAKLEADAEAARAAAMADGHEETVLQRRKLGRGSSRRIVRAKDALDAALTAFCKEMDFEVFAIDAEGRRTGRWPVLDEIDAFKIKVLAATSDILA